MKEYTLVIAEDLYGKVYHEITSSSYEEIEKAYDEIKASGELDLDKCYVEIFTSGTAWAVEWDSVDVSEHGKRFMSYAEFDTKEEADAFAASRPGSEVVEVTYCS